MREGDFVACDGGFGGVPLFVWAGELEVLEFFAIAGFEALGVVEGEDDFSVLLFHARVEGAREDDVFAAVVVYEGETGEAGADVMLIAGVNVGGVADVVDDGHATFGDGFEGAAHLVLDDDPAVLVLRAFEFIFEAGELDPVE